MNLTDNFNKENSDQLNMIDIDKAFSNLSISCSLISQSDNWLRTAVFQRGDDITIVHIDLKSAYIYYILPMSSAAHIKNQLSNISDKNNSDSLRLIERVTAKNHKNLILPGELFTVFWNFEDISKEEQLTPLNPSDNPANFKYQYVKLLNSAQYQKGEDLHDKKMLVIYIIIK